MTVPELVRAVEAAGFEIQVTDNGPRLIPPEHGVRPPFELLKLLKQHRAEVMVYVRTGAREPVPDAGEREICRVCGADVSDPETRALLVDPLHCWRAGGKTVTTEGRVIEGCERCPYKPKN